MPASGTWMARTPAACGSSSVRRARWINSHLTPLAWPRLNTIEHGRFGLASGDNHLATDFVRTPSAAQNCSMAVLPARQFVPRASCLDDNRYLNVICRSCAPFDAERLRILFPARWGHCDWENRGSAIRCRDLADDSAADNQDITGVHLWRA